MAVTEARTFFITGTDTGVGKTVVTSLLIAHARSKGMKARCLKPFCSGDRADALLLWDLQDREIPLDEINPYFFKEPVSPWTAARREGREILLSDVMETIERFRPGADLVLVEGAGGICTPLGGGGGGLSSYDAAQLIDELECDVIAVAPNRLGVLNQLVLTVASAHPGRACNRELSEFLRIALVDQAKPDASSVTNFEDLQLLLHDHPMEAPPIVQIPHLENFRAEVSFIRGCALALRSELAQLLA